MSAREKRVHHPASQGFHPPCCTGFEHGRWHETGRALEQACQRLSAPTAGPAAGCCLDGRAAHCAAAHTRRCFPPPPRRAAVRTLGLLVVLQGAFTDSARCPALSALSSTSVCVEAHVSAVGVAALFPVPASAGSRGPPGHATAARTLGAECQGAASSNATSTSAISATANNATNSA